MDPEEDPSISCRVWRDGRLVGDRVRRSQIARALRDEDCLVWLDLVQPEREHLQWLVEEFGLWETEVEDALAPHERPKVTRHGDHLFFTVYSTLLDGEGKEGGRRLSARRISAFVLPTALVTMRDQDFDLAPVLAMWETNADLLKYGSRALVHGLLDAIVDGHFDTIQQLDDEIEALEDELFAERRTGQAFVRQTYGVRKDLVALRRVVLPMREVVNGLLRHSGEGHHRETELGSWFDDLYDHVLRAGEWTESLRDMVTSVFETNLSLQDARLNSVMKQLASWAAIIAVPTAITGWFGQNVPYPGVDQPWGVWLSVGTIVLSSAVLYVVFRRRDWL